MALLNQTTTMVIFNNFFYYKFCVLECGAGFTQKLEGMFKDIENSKEFGVCFKQVILLFILFFI